MRLWTVISDVCADMASQSKGVVKRGYLFDKKGLLDRKRWYVLCQDVARGSCFIEVFKDEKAAARMDSPKCLINVHDIVEVRRVVDRKQSFEVLCPGLGYRFMANSDVEADEWVHTIRGLILYRRDQAHTTHFPSVPNCHTQPVSISHSAPSHPRTSTLPHLSPSSPYPLHTNLPTPPDLSTSPATLPSCRSMHRQCSTEMSPAYSFLPLPSPPSSSSESSMASGSNASCEQPLSSSENDTDFIPTVPSNGIGFRVQVKETEGLKICGAADLVLGDGRLALHTPDTGHLLVSWPIAALRRYGANNVSLTIVTGRNCSTGEGKFQFYTQHSRRVYSRLHTMAISKAASRTEHVHRMGSESAVRLSPPLVHCGSQLEPLATAADEYSGLSMPQAYSLRHKTIPVPHSSEDGHSTSTHQQSHALTTSTLC